MSETIGHLPLCDVQANASVLLGTTTVLVTYARHLWELATDRGQVVDGREENPYEEDNAW